MLEKPQLLPTSNSVQQQMDTSIGQFRGVGGDNTTAIALDKNAQDRKQPIFASAVMGSILLLVLALLAVLLVMRHRAQKRRVRDKRAAIISV
ncbi:hypothetical protein B0J13DRAFT_669792 [Dactylonectria estremocensis]|uniref:Uncharacterized protein n=1 Tax=Dactylonectria estremocensis TaxID=1079267 RepID=A0A9P9FLG3_9HYPO|nr:hypothetical protein B0J13DRAFT_669792 [Dactylonectria estremocensis]